ncbi:hypothetical protein R5W24_002542 [Gemmata sp. JC717]|uniref:hypothetical protein n=1 Tax=Gemmata algarum TaxID=2975278 RepID=UPI0021BBA952|nr:hypothetical protein [Gemmata algarum]MDY3553440.1 hypothetical protein [Gemmata algarum]
MMQPRVCPVQVCPCEPGTSGAAGPKWNTWIKEFGSAAHIAIPRFDLDGACVPGDGLVIYEGMRLTVDPDSGQYDVSFTATLPRMPVTLNIQLTFVNPHKPQDPRTLTLPPIRLEPKRDARPGDPSGWTFRVEHRGYSTTLLHNAGLRGHIFNAENGGAPVVINQNWELRRTATARFGSPIAIENPNR